MTFPIRLAPPYDLQPTPKRWEIGPIVLCDLPTSRFATLAKQLRMHGAYRLRWWDHDEDAPRVLVQLQQPSAYLIDRLLDDPTNVVFRQQAQNLWVPVGWRSPTEPIISPGHWLLCYHERTIEIRQTDFHDEQLEWPLLSAAPMAIEQVFPAWPVRLKLVPTHDDEPARLWVLRDDALAQLSAYCRTANELLLQRFQVAIGSNRESVCVVLRAVATKGPPPVFIGATVSYRPYLRLPNLYLPVGTKLTPNIRREALRQLTQEQPNRLVWLHPTNHGTFQAESLPDAAFRPLPELLDYRAMQATRRRNAWVQVPRLGFEPFVEATEIPKLTVKPPATVDVGPVEQSRSLVARAFRWLIRSNQPKKRRKSQAPYVEPEATPTEKARPSVSQADRLHLARPETNNYTLERCQAVESRFLQNLPNATAEQLASQWAELATAYDAVGSQTESAVCWLNAIWNEPTPSPLTLWNWLQAESKSTNLDVMMLDPQPWLASSENPHHVRALAAWVVWAVRQQPVPSFLTNHISDIQQRLEAAETGLPIRAAWLARIALAKLEESNDVLGLARTRERLLQRIYQSGLNVELDSPSFIRFAGDGMRERFHEARKWLTDKHELIQQWITHTAQGNPYTHVDIEGSTLQSFGLETNIAHTQAYANLLFAWGLMRFSQVAAAEQLRKQAHDALPNDDVHLVLRDAFEYRIAQVREGKPIRGPLPELLLARIATLNLTQRYIVHKLREHSRILEPTNYVEPYSSAGIGEHSNEPMLVFRQYPPEQLNRELLRPAAINQSPRAHTLMMVALERATELNDEAIDVVVQAMNQTLEVARQTPRQLARIIERGLAACIVWDRVELAQHYAQQILQLVDGRGGWDVTEGLTAQAVRCLRRFGLKKEADRLLHEVSQSILQGQSIAKLRTMKNVEWARSLRVLLNVAGGWYFAGRDEQAHAILDEARKDLFSEERSDRERTALAYRYTNALAYAPVRIALGRLEEMFQRLRGIDTKGTTNGSYSLHPLMLVEAAVRVVVSDDFTMGPEVRSWLDADEFAVRRRMNEELKVMMRQQGLA